MLARKLADYAVWNNVYERYRVYLHTETTGKSVIGLSRVSFSNVDTFVQLRKKIYINFTGNNFLATVDRSMAQRCGNGIFLKYSGKRKKRREKERRRKRKRKGDERKGKRNERNGKENKRRSRKGQENEKNKEILRINSDLRSPLRFM